MRVTTLLGVTAAAALAVAAPASAHRGGATTVHDVDVIAHGLDNPRHVAVSRDGDVYVAEAGVGGDPATSKSCFNSAEGPSCTGDTGAVTRIWRHRWHYDQERVLTGLASFAPVTGDSAIGPHGVFVAGRDVLVTNGGPTGPTRGPDPTARCPCCATRRWSPRSPSRACSARCWAPAARPRARARRPVALRGGQQPRRGGRHRGDRQQPGRRVRRPQGDRRGGRGREHAAARLAPRRGQRPRPVPERVPAEPVRRGRRPDERGADGRRARPGRRVLHEPAHRLPVPDRGREHLPGRSPDRRVHDVRDRVHERDGPGLRARRHALRARDRSRLAAGAKAPTARCSRCRAAAGRACRSSCPPAR